MSDNRNQIKGCGEAQRITVAAEIVQQASILHQRAQLLSERTRSRLTAISRQETPVEARKTAEPRPEFPPLFNELREHFQGIDRFLLDIEESLDRLEI